MGSLEQKDTVYHRRRTPATRTAIGALTVERFEQGLIGSMALDRLRGHAQGRRSARLFRMADFKLTDLDLTPGVHGAVVAGMAAGHADRPHRSR